MTDSNSPKMQKPSQNSTKRVQRHQVKELLTRREAVIVIQWQ